MFKSTIAPPAPQLIRSTRPGVGFVDGGGAMNGLGGSMTTTDERGLFGAAAPADVVTADAAAAAYVGNLLSLTPITFSGYLDAAGTFAVEDANGRLLTAFSASESGRTGIGVDADPDFASATRLTDSMSA